MDRDRVTLLGSTSLFEGLSAADLTGLASHVSERKYVAGQIVFAQGDVSDAMFIVAQGQLNIFLPGEGSQRVSLKDIGPTDYFGELALFQSKPRTASVLATTDCVLLELHRSELEQYVEKHPRAALALARTMMHRLRETNELLSQRARNVVEEIDQSLTWKDRLADKIAVLNGSWSFVVLLLGVTTVWMIANASWLIGGTFDPYPYVFFNLVLAILVALQGPLIVMSQNRQSQKDRKTSEVQYQVNLRNEAHIDTILRELHEFRMETAARLDAQAK